MAQSHKVVRRERGFGPLERTLVAQSHKGIPPAGWLRATGGDVSGSEPQGRSSGAGFGPRAGPLVAQSHKVVRWRGYFVTPEGTPAVDGGSA